MKHHYLIAKVSVILTVKQSDSLSKERERLQRMETLYVL